jgi:hypothetical protein
VSFLEGSYGTLQRLVKQIKSCRGHRHEITCDTQPLPEGDNLCVSVSETQEWTVSNQWPAALGRQLAVVRQGLT